MTPEEKAAEEWMEAVREIRAAVEDGTILCIAWLTEGSAEGRYHFGHYGYRAAREVVTNTLITMRDTDTSKEAN